MTAATAKPDEVSPALSTPMRTRVEIATWIRDHHRAGRFTYVQAIDHLAFGLGAPIGYAQEFIRQRAST